MKSKWIIRYLKKYLEHMKYYNNLAPFPVFDTSYVVDLEKKLIEIMSEKTKEYDEEPVVACKYCKSLHIKLDEIDNSICMRCGSVNDLQDFKNIYKYKEWSKNKDE